jgi:hypothetical protein
VRCGVSVLLASHRGLLVRGAEGPAILLWLSRVTPLLLLLEPQVTGKFFTGLLKLAVSYEVLRRTAAVAFERDVRHASVRAVAVSPGGVVWVTIYGRVLAPCCIRSLHVLAAAGLQIPDSSFFLPKNFNLLFRRERLLGKKSVDNSSILALLLESQGQYEEQGFVWVGVSHNSVRSNNFAAVFL